MAWVPIHESGAEWSFESNDAGATIAGSTVSLDLAFGLSGFLFRVTIGTEGEIIPEQVRVTPNYSASITSPPPGSVAYTPARFSDGFGDIYLNEAAPYPDQLDTPYEVSGWSPTPIEMFVNPSGGQTNVDYTPAFYSGEFGMEEQASFLIEVWSDGPEPPVDECNYNCSCEDEYPTRTLAQMREFLMIRLGWAAMKDTPLPGVNDTLNAFLQDAQDQLHAEYRLPRLERFFTWDLVEGVRFYDLAENADECTKELDPRQLTWVGISDGCDAWRKLVCGIPPESYYSQVSGIPSRYEIRQCIEVWPPPGGDEWKLRIKGYFYNESLTEDTDVASLDYQAVQLFALANAKAHYGQADAANVMRQAMRYVANMTAGAHHTRRYVPGTTEWVAPPLPVLTGYPGDP